MDDTKDAIAIGTLASVARYPIKSLPGVSMSQTNLHAGRGIIGDRAYAFGLKEQPIAPQGAWTPCNSFERLTIRPAMAAWSVTRESYGIVFEGPDAERVTLAERAEPLIQGRPFGGGDLIAARQSYWDHADAALSIINLSTVEALSQAAGVTLDPARFRANLYVRAAPWSEFGWLGKSISIGPTTLRILRPTDRCRATSVRPGLGAADINLPALLHRKFGHMYCGVYACVETGGTIVAGDVIGETSDAFDPSLIRSAASQRTAPPIANWPRQAVVEDVVDEAENIRSVWLSDPLAKSSALDHVHAGQHVRLHGLDKDGTWRAYTISGIDAERGRLRVTVKRDRGPGSRSVHQLSIGSRVTISGPAGDFRIPKAPATSPAWFMTAGIGITPAVATLRERAFTVGRRPVRVIHSVQNLENAALWDEVLAALKRPADTATLHVTRPDHVIDAKDGIICGRPDLASIATRIKADGGTVMICGPTAFTRHSVEALRFAGVPDAHVAFETFASPDDAPDLAHPPSPGPHKVRFTRSGIDATWTAADGTLLDLAERHGLNPPSHCRAGICGTCRTIIQDGQGVDLVQSPAASAGKLLLCCAVPTSDIELDA